MLNMICNQFCPAPFCITVCPVDALSVSSKDNNIYVDTDKCNRCRLCGFMCVTYSRDRSLQGKRPWVSTDFVKAAR